MVPASLGGKEPLHLSSHTPIPGTGSENAQATQKQNVVPVVWHCFQSPEMPGGPDPPGLEVPQGEVSGTV